MAKVLKSFSLGVNKEYMYNILVVEDDEVDQMNIVRAFQKANIANDLYFARDGQDAIDILRKEEIKKPLLILLDLNMPRMNGLEFLQILRSNPEWKQIPVVVLTTSNVEKDKMEAYNLMVAGYVVKPVAVADFMVAVSKIESYWSLCEFPGAIK